ncbi:hypothetical protein [Gallaecimonas sp. GXIMD4217]|uniref:zinc ribbon-containing protein n=1 Tax=Gallaecimonas sp. GXIMD4217 TaxID=3131927 RepID=UPI00311B320B
MPLKAYNRLLEEVKQRLKDAPVGQKLDELVDEAAEFLHAAGELTKDEWALVKAKLMDDLKALDEQEQDLPPSAKVEEFWKYLAEMADPTQLVWRELARDFAHPEGYQSGDVLGFGALRCQKCGFVLHFYHPDRIPDCPQCGHDRFQREQP